MENKNFKIVALALHVSIFMYVFVLYFLQMQTPAEQWVFGLRILPENQFFTLVLGLLALITTGLAIFLKPVVPRMALAESVAIYGFVIAFLNYSFLLIVPFALWALILQIFVGPWFAKTE